MKKTIIIAILALATCASYARGHHGHHGHMHHSPPMMHHSPPPPPHMHHRHHHSPVVPFAVGLGTGLILNSALPPPPVQPVVVAPQQIWVPPVYGERPIYRAGIYVGTERYIITPGYWR